MVNKRWASIITPTLILAVLGYGFFNFDGKVQLEEIEQSFLLENYQQTDRLLTKNKQQIPLLQYNLYQSYVLRASGKINESNKLLDKSLRLADKDIDNMTLKEVYLNRLLNAHVEKDVKTLTLLLSKAKSFEIYDDAWLKLFASIEAYLNQDYEKSLIILKSSDLQKDYYSPWMKKVFKKEFSPLWQNIHFANCKIALGQYLLARQELELTGKNANDHEKNLINFLLGYSYFKEAETFPLETNNSLLQLAVTNFSLVKNLKKSFPEKYEEILTTFQQNASTLINRNEFSDLTLYIESFEKWNENSSLDVLKKELVQILDNVIEKDDIDTLEKLSSNLAALMPDEKIKLKIEKRFEKNIDRLLDNDLLNNIERSLNLALTFSSDPYGLLDHVSTKTYQKIIQTIPGDDKFLTKTKNYIEFWKKIINDPEDQYSLAIELIIIAEGFWKKERNEKAVQLMAIAKTLPNFSRKKIVSERIEKSFKDAYESALKYDNIKELKLILDAVNELELTDVDIFNSLQKGNQLEDAEWLYQSKRFKEAKIKAEWLLKLDPQDRKAKKILGLIAYDNADYKEAFIYLNNLFLEDSYALGAQGVSYILYDQYDKGIKILDKLEKENKITDNVLLRLGFGFLVKNNPKKASVWFNKLNNPSDEKTAGLIFTAYQLQNYQEVINLYPKLPDLYKSIDGLSFIVIESQIALNKIDDAKKNLTNLLNAPPEKSKIHFSSYFQAFKKEMLDEKSRFAAAAAYYKNVEKDYKQSLAYFNKIYKTTLKQDIEKAEVLIKLEMFEDAKQLLLAVRKEVKKTEKNYLLNIALPLLASIEMKLGNFFEAANYYKEYLQFNPGDVTYRSEYADILKKFGRFDLARAQYEQLMRIRGLTYSEKVLYVESLVKSNKFSQANKYADNLLLNKSLPLKEKIQIANLMLITENKNFIDQIMKNLPKAADRSVDENIETLRLYIQLGDYEKANELVKEFKNEFETKPKALLLIAELKANLSDINGSLKYAQKALSLDPFDEVTARFFEHFERNINDIKESKKLIVNKLQSEPDNISLQISYAKELIELAIESYALGNILELEQSFDLLKARSVLEKIIQITEEIPRAYFLYGKTEYLLDNYEASISAYKTALTLNPSYVEAYQHLALCFEELNDYTKSIKAVSNAIRFDLNNADIWEQLANLYAIVENTSESIVAYKQAIKFKPNEPAPYVKLAKQYIFIYNPESAVLNLEKALELKPNDQEIQKLLLIALNDPNLTGKDKRYENRQKEIYNRLKRLNPLAAKEISKLLGLTFD